MSARLKLDPAEKKSSTLFSWDGQSYAKNSTPQADRNRNTLKRFGLKKGETGLDIGCGNGKTTQEIADAIYPGEVIGVDKDESMLKAAQCHVKPNLHFVKGDAAKFKLFKSVDFVTSFFCLQWMPPAELPASIQNIYEHLKAKGRVCISLPTYDFTHEVIKGVAFSPKWMPYFKGFKDAQTFYPRGFYEELFKKTGFSDIKIDLQESLHPLTDEGFIEYTRQWCGCYTWLKDEKLLNAFIEDIRERLATEVHLGDKIQMVQKSMHIFAEKPREALVLSSVPIKAKL